MGEYQSGTNPGQNNTSETSSSEYSRGIGVGIDVGIAIEKNYEQIEKIINKQNKLEEELNKLYELYKKQEELIKISTRLHKLIYYALIGLPIALIVACSAYFLFANVKTSVFGDVIVWFIGFLGAGSILYIFKFLNEIRTKIENFEENLNNIKNISKL